MITRLTPKAAANRRDSILQSARWCFLNFGLDKTSLDDIAKRASMSRTLLYKSFRNKEDIFAAVFADWLVARQPAAVAASRSKAEPFDRLLGVCRLLVLEPWIDMVGAPMAGEFFDACERVDPQVTEDHRRVTHRCVAAVIGDEAAEVFLLALDGLLGDQPSADVLEGRIRLLTARFVQAPLKKKKR